MIESDDADVSLSQIVLDPNIETPKLAIGELTINYISKLTLYL